MASRDDRRERIYAGVLGKIIGVYLGRPVEMWDRQRVRRTFGAVDGYLAARAGLPLVVADDDISGTFTFIRAAAGLDRLADLTAERVADVWLADLVENRTTLWWGGFGNSTEHTAWRRLRSGIGAPRSGSAALNGAVVANQIGAQIFADGWALLAPGDPGAAARAARLAARVSHDGDALDAAAAVAAMQSAAFLEPSLDRLFDLATGVIAPDGLVRRIHDSVRAWVAEGRDWEATMDRIETTFTTEAYPGNCHLAPNHAVFAAAILHGRGRFGDSVRLAVQAGMDTDSNAGNVGCLLGIRNGLEGLSDGHDWRGPVSDRLVVVSADGGGVFTDALSVADSIWREGRRLAGGMAPSGNPARAYRFDAAGAVQGFRCMADGTVSVGNASGTGLELAWHGAVENAYVATQTARRPGDPEPGPYEIHASPAVYPGQRLAAALAASAGDCRLRLAAEYATATGRRIALGPAISENDSAAGGWVLPDIDEGAPICSVGIAVSADRAGTARIACLSVDGGAALTFVPDIRNSGKALSWVAACEHFNGGTRDGNLRVSHGGGVGVAHYGCRRWRDIRVVAELRAHLAGSFGLVVGVQGLGRWIAVQVTGGRTRAVTLCRDGRSRTLAEGAVNLPRPGWIRCAVSVNGGRLLAECAGTALEADIAPDDGTGAIGVCCSEGTVDLRLLAVSPCPPHAGGGIRRRTG